MIQLPVWLSDKESTSNAGDAGTGNWSLGREDLLEEEIATTPVFFFFFLIYYFYLINLFILIRG